MCQYVSKARRFYPSFPLHASRKRFTCWAIILSASSFACGRLDDSDTQGEGRTTGSPDQGGSLAQGGTARAGRDAGMPTTGGTGGAMATSVGDSSRMDEGGWGAGSSGGESGSTDAEGGSAATGGTPTTGGAGGAMATSAGASGKMSEGGSRAGSSGGSVGGEPGSAATGGSPTTGGTSGAITTGGVGGATAGSTSGGNQNCSYPNSCKEVLGACLARADGLLTPEDSTNLSFTATVLGAPVVTAEPKGVCTQFDEGGAFDQFIVRDESGLDFVLSASVNEGMRAPLAPGAVVEVGLRTGTQFGFAARPVVVSVHSEDQLEWFVMSGSSPLPFQIPKFEIVFDVEYLMCRNACIPFAVPSFATLGATTIRDACGDRLGDFSIRQTSRFGGSGGMCDSPSVYRSSAIRVH